MENLHAQLTVSMSEFKKNPTAVLRSAGGRPVAVLNHNKAACYVLDPKVFQALLDELEDQALQRIVLARLSEIPKAVEVDLGQE